ncbi:hypothetical protein AX774_g5348 [Zancudomyces culisetae]|uniref:Inhibitor I9 domain-containing protein n=1 Tax=Zancudomyces culisetae TaxID=1213189 RepID=A0A1R1PJU5_ZANCU|nr:hypothetical protein AX774_g5348 [Zancudomyces culisetae]|eukprot:OMH81193.1 hypothetical protein AX774_g5348 [Zancudomyces culisetae]
MKLSTVFLAFVATNVAAVDVCKSAISKCGNGSGGNEAVCLESVGKYIVVLDSEKNIPQLVKAKIARGKTYEQELYNYHMESLNSSVGAKNSNVIFNTIESGASSKKGASKDRIVYMDEVNNLSFGGYVAYSAALNLEMVSDICLRPEVKFVEADQIVTANKKN